MGSALAGQGRPRVRRRSFRSLATAALLLPMGLAVPGDPGPAAADTVAPTVSPCFPSDDNGDPVLTSLHISPAAVDATHHAAQVTFTATAFDTGGPGAPSGLRDVTVFIGYQPDGTYTSTTTLLPTPAGTLVGSVTVKTGWRTGIRYILGVDVTDVFGNTRSYGGSALDLPDVERTYRASTSPDTHPPKLVGLRVSSTEVDARRQARAVRVVAHVRDDVAVARVIVGFSHVQYAGGPRKVHLQRSSGSAHDGIWTGRLLIGRWQTTGPRRLWVNMKDTIANISVVRGNGLSRRGLPSTLQLLSGSDRSVPTVQVLSVTPGPMDVTVGPGTLTVVVRARDARSGVLAITGSLDGPGDATTDFRLKRVSGDRHDGRWRGTVTLRPCQTPPGRWVVFLNATDLPGNFGTATPLPRFNVAGLDVTTPTATLASPVPPLGPLVVSFDEDVRGLSAATATMHVSTEMENSGTNTASGAHPGSWACTDAAGGSVSCEEGPLRQARFTPSSPFTANAAYWLVLNPEHQLALADMFGNPYNRSALDFYPVP
jgi:hypothetical protein